MKSDLSRAISEPDLASPDSDTGEIGTDSRSLPSASLGRSLVIAIRLSWDRLGMVLAVSLLGVVVSLLGLSVGLLLPAVIPVPVKSLCVAVCWVLLFAPLTAGAFAVADRAADHREITPLHLWEGARRFGGVAIRLGLIHLFVALVAATNAFFYVNLGGAFGAAALTLSIGLVAFWTMMALYQGPLLIAQETGVFDTAASRAKRGAKAVIRRSFFLALGEPLFSLGLLAATLIWSALAFLTAVGAALLWLGTLCLLTTLPTRALLRRYAILPENEDSPAKEA